MKSVTRLCAAIVFCALAATAGGASMAAADVAPVRRVSCPSVAAINAIPTSIETRSLETLAATPDTCRYEGADGSWVDFTFHPGATTVLQVENAIRASYPPELRYLFRPAPVPALGAGAFYFADAGPISAYWELSPGAIAQMTFALSWQEPEIIAVAKLFRPALEVYTIPGERTVNGRQWRTSCEEYSRTARCRTDIYATVIRKTASGYVKVNDWAFNSLTYRWSDRGLWATNPLGYAGSWTSVEGRKWRTDCDSPATGRGACRSYVRATVLGFKGGKYTSENVWVFNNQVLFS